MLDHIEQLIDRAIEAQTQGNFLLATELYLELLKINPRDPDANHNLGILNVQIGRLDDAILFLENAINSNSEVCQYWITLADTFIKMDRLLDAKQIIQQARELGHEDSIFNKMLQHIASVKNDNEEKDTLYHDPPEKLLKKVRKLNVGGDEKKFFKLLLRALKEFPKSPQLNEIAGHAFRSKGNLNKSVHHFEEVLKFDLNRLASYINLAVVFIELEKFGDAIDLLNKGKLIYPDDSKIYYNLGVAYVGEGLLQEAVPLYRKAIKLNSNFYDAYINLANAYGELGRIDLSLKTIEQVVALEPDKYEVYYNLGHYLKISGDFDGAKNAYSKSLEINPYSAPTHHGLSSLTKYSENTEHLNTLQKIVGNKLLEGDTELIHFALAKAYEDLGDNQKAFVEYKTANNIRNDKVGYDHNLQLKLIETIIENNDLLKSISIETEVTKTAPKPIFILGMPRSGTTLVEQIISSHSTIAPAGELKSVQLFNGLLAEAKVHISEMQISLFRKSYLRELDQYRNGEKFVTDKLPHNFMAIALIRCAFPESPIVHVKRDSAATCWSNYKQAFTKNSLKYSYNLENTVNFYRMYENMMDFWYDEYPDKIYTLEYEKLVNNTDHETKKLIEYIGVGWEEACLKPHLNKRNVKTASQSQVRKKIYSGSSEQWKKFEPFLDGAFDKLIK